MSLGNFTGGADRGRDDPSLTSVSLLERVARNLADSEAWGDFVDRYAPKIYGWCRSWGLQASDSEDLTQTVLLKLAVKMRTFRYDASKTFRGWLRTLALNAYRDWAAEARASIVGGMPGSDAPGLAALLNAEASEDFARRLEAEFDLELYEEATRRVKTRVLPKTWDAFRLTAIEGLPGAEVAARLEMNVSAVYMARSNVLARLRDEVKRLDSPEQASP